MLAGLNKIFILKYHYHDVDSLHHQLARKQQLTFARNIIFTYYMHS